MKSYMLTEVEKTIKIPEIIYHYTSPEGLINILDKKQLWFSRFDCLNDASEGKYIQEVFSKTILKLRKEKEVDETFLNAIEDVKPNFLHFFRITGQPKDFNKDVQVIRGVRKASKPYLCCFSRNRDSLPMWNYYSKGDQFEGYNIGFHYEETLQIHENIEVMRVIYRESEQIQILKEEIKNIAAMFYGDQNSADLCRYNLVAILSARAIQFKNKAFEHEQEMRLVYWEPEDDNNIEVDKETVYYRQKRGIVIPYLKTGFDKEQIRSLTIGPLIQADIAEKTVNDMLMNKQFSRIKITHSDIPIRY